MDKCSDSQKAFKQMSPKEEILTQKVGRTGTRKQASSNRLQCWESHPENRSLNPFICGTICWPHSVGNGYTKSTENCRVARHRNQIKPDALKVTNAPKCESQADVHEWLSVRLISGAFRENVTLPSLWNIIDNVHCTPILANGEMPERNKDLWKI